MKTTFLLITVMFLCNQLLSTETLVVKSIGFGLTSEESERSAALNTIEVLNKFFYPNAILEDVVKHRAGLIMPSSKKTGRLGCFYYCLGEYNIDLNSLENIFNKASQIEINEFSFAILKQEVSKYCELTFVNDMVEMFDLHQQIGLNYKIRKLNPVYDESSNSYKYTVKIRGFINKNGFEADSLLIKTLSFFSLSDLETKFYESMSGKFEPINFRVKNGLKNELSFSLIDIRTKRILEISLENRRANRLNFILNLNGKEYCPFFEDGTRKIQYDFTKDWFSDYFNEGLYQQVYAGQIHVNDSRENMLKQQLIFIKTGPSYYRMVDGFYEINYKDVNYRDVPGLYKFNAHERSADRIVNQTEATNKTSEVKPVNFKFCFPYLDDNHFLYEVMNIDTTQLYWQKTNEMDMLFIRYMKGSLSMHSNYSLSIKDLYAVDGNKFPSSKIRKYVSDTGSRYYNNDTLPFLSVGDTLNNGIIFTLFTNGEYGYKSGEVHGKVCAFKNLKNDIIFDDFCFGLNHIRWDEKSFYGEQLTRNIIKNCPSLIINEISNINSINRAFWYIPTDDDFLKIIQSGVSSLHNGEDLLRTGRYLLSNTSQIDFSRLEWWQGDDTYSIRLISNF